TLYTWFAYADDGDGNGISLDSTGKKYLGIAVNQETSEADISDASVFNWTAIEGGESDSIHLTITSSNGVVFKSGLVATTLTAHIYKNGVELTEEAVAGIGVVKWYEIDGGEIGTGLTKNISDVEVANIIAKLEEI
ncbi:MAG: hypothetical protein GX777_03115, partial [Fastidiosipila sp.]|nr:hypothetical protein [Fastidiosipila sp.]